MQHDLDTGLLAHLIDDHLERFRVKPDAPLLERFLPGGGTAEGVHPLCDLLQDPLNDRRMALRGGVGEDGGDQASRRQAAQETVPLDEHRTGPVPRGRDGSREAARPATTDDDLRLGDDWSVPGRFADCSHAADLLTQPQGTRIELPGRTTQRSGALVTIYRRGPPAATPRGCARQRDPR